MSGLLSQKKLGFASDYEFDDDDDDDDDEFSQMWNLIGLPILFLWTLGGVATSSYYLFKPSNFSNNVVKYYGIIGVIIVIVGWSVLLGHEWMEESELQWQYAMLFIFLTLAITVSAFVVGWLIHTNFPQPIREGWQQVLRVIFALGSVLIAIDFALEMWRIKMRNDDDD